MSRTPTLPRFRGPLRCLLALVLALLGGLTLPAAAPTHPLENFDARLTRNATAASARTVSAAALTAERRLADRVPGAYVDRDEILGAPKFVAAREGFLTPPAARADPSVVLARFLLEYRDLFAFGPEALEAARQSRDDITPRTGLHTRVWQQQWEEIPIFEAVLKASLTKRGELINVGSSFLADPKSAAGRGHPQRTSLAPSPVLRAESAIAAAARQAGLGVAIVGAPEAKPDGPERKQKFAARGRLAGASVRLVWLPLDRETLRLCWKVLLVSRLSGRLFQLVVDAETAEVYVRHNLTADAQDASYTIFSHESPRPMLPGLGTVSTAQPAPGGRDFVTLPSLNATASPNGWINEGDNTTAGNNVDARTNPDNAVSPPVTNRATGSPFRVFDSTFGFGSAPAANARASTIQLFYWCNLLHDKLYDLGFTETAGNFQTDNFGRGGNAGDRVQADALSSTALPASLASRNNANFSTPPDGDLSFPPQMRMYVFDGQPYDELGLPTGGPDLLVPDRDGSFDATIVFHEYVHGLSNRLVGGGMGISGRQSRAMGEGWSDFYALSLLSKASDDVEANYPVGAYATTAFLGTANYASYYYGIRRYPYSTSLLVQPLTFKDIDSSQASAHAGVPVNPISVNASASEAHAAGEVWCAMLWDVRANLVRKLGHAAGNAVMLQIVTDGMKLAPAGPNFVQARNAIYQAEEAYTSGAHRLDLEQGFAKRGLGADATSPDGFFTAGVVESYRVNQRPLVVLASPAHGSAVTALTTISGTATDPDGTAFSPNEVALTLFDIAQGEYWNGSAWTTTQTVLAASIAPGGAWSYAGSLPTGANARTGQFAVSCSVRNAAGVRSQPQTGVTNAIFRIDNTAPALAFTTPLNGAVISVSLTSLGGTATDADSVALVNVFLRRIADNSYWNGSQWIPFTGTYPPLSAQITPGFFSYAGALPPIGSADPVTQMPAGDYELIAVGLDRAGNQAQTASGFRVEILRTWTGGTLRDQDPNNNTNSWSAPGNWAGGAVPGPGDIVIIDNGDYVDAAGSRTIAGLRLSGGSSVGNADLTVTGAAGASKWSSGTMQGTLTVAAAAALEIDTTGFPTIVGTLANSGTVTITGDLNANPAARMRGTSSLIDNLGVVEFARDGVIFENTSTTPLFHNHGSGAVRKSAGTGTTDFGNFRFSTNSAVFDVQTGTLRFTSEVTLTNLNSVVGAGTLRLESSNVQVSGLLNVFGNLEVPAGGIVTFNTVGLAVSAPAHFRLTGGALSGIATLSAGSKLEIDTTQGPAFNGLNLTNHGTITIGGDAGTGRLYGTSTTLTNETDGRLEFARAGVILQNTSTTPVVVNRGTIAKTFASGSADFGNWTLDGRANAAYEIAGGTLRLTAAVTLLDGTTCSGAGLLRLESPSIALAGTFRALCEVEIPPGAGVTLNAVTLDLTPSKPFRMTGGVISGAVTLPAGKRLDVDTTQTPSWNGLNFTNQGLIVLSGDPVNGRLAGTSTTLINEVGAVIELARAGQIFVNTSTIPVLIQRGTLAKTEPAGLTDFGNWTLDSQPNAIYTIGGGVFRLTAGVALRNGTVFSGAGTARFLTGDCSISGLFTTSCSIELPSAGITLNACTLTTTGAGRIVQSGGYFTGTATIPHGSRLEVDTTATPAWSGLALTNHGTIVIGGDPVDGRLNGTSTTLTNETDGRLEFARAGQIFTNTSTTPLVTQRGTLAKTTTTGLTDFGNWRLDGAANAVFTLAGGSLRFNHDVSFGAGTQFAGAGLVRLESGSITLNGRLDVTVPTQFNVGALTANSAEIATLVGGSFAWNGGQISGSVTVPAGSTWTIDTTANPYLPGASLLNHGSLIIIGNPASGALLGTSSTLTNFADGRIELARDGLIFLNTSTTPQLVNLGTIVKTAGGGTTDFGNYALTNSTGGTLQALTGVFRCTSAVSLAPDSQFAGPGSVRLENAGVSLSGRLLVNTVTEMPSGTLDCGGSGNAQIVTGASGQFLWSGGVITGILTIPAASRLDIDTTAFPYLPGTTIHNAGRLVITGSALGGTLRGTSSAINNLATGSLEFARDGIIFENTSTPPIVSNLGTIVKTGGTGQTDFGNFTLANAGAIQVPLGRILQFTSTLSLLGGSVIGGTGAVRLNSASVSLSGATVIAANTLLELTGVLNGPTSGGQPLGSLAGPGTFRWSQGAITGFVPFTANSNVVFDTNFSLTLAGTITLAGNATLGGALPLYGSSSTLAVLAGGTLQIPAAFSFVNTSTPPVLQNAGTVRLGASAVVTSSWNYAQTATGVVDFALNGAGAGQFAQVQLAGNATIAGHLKVTRFSGYVPTSGTTFPILTFGSRSGTFTSTAGLGLYNGDKLAPILGPNSLSLEVVRSALGNWMDEKFGADAGNPLVAGPMATPAGDGIPNALKYAFNLDPMLPGTSGLPKPVVLTDPQTQQRHLGLSFRRRMNATDPLYFPRVSNGLDGAWDASGVQLEFVGVPVATGDGVTEVVTVRLLTPMQPGGKAFLDVQVDYE